MLLVIIEKFETNLVLVNVNKLKPYKYTEFEVEKQEQQMPVYWEQSASKIQMKIFNTKEEDEGCEMQKPQMQSVMGMKNYKNRN